MKNLFTNLYEHHKAVLIDVHKRCEANGGEIIGPYLIEPNAAYVGSGFKLVFVGQETGDWASSYCDVPHQLACYRDFNLNGHATRSTHPGAFWNVIRKLEREVLGVTHACAALNLNRFSQDGHRPSWQNQQIMAELDFLVLEELRLLKPDLVVFFTGPSYDHRLQALLRPTWSPVDGFTTRQLCALTSTDLACPAFRTYHPTYLRRRHFEDRVISTIKTLARG